MADYRAIKGLHIQTVSSDNATIQAGDIWYNSTLGKIRVVKIDGSWATTNNMNTARFAFGNAGIQTAALASGGDSHPASPRINAITESYNGSTWTEVADLNQARRALAGFGTTTAALAFGGYIDTPGPSSLNESWNGASWTEVNNLNTARYNHAGAGTTTAGLSFGGNTGSVTAINESWNGTSWTETADLNTARYAMA